MALREFIGRAAATAIMNILNVHKKSIDASIKSVNISGKTITITKNDGTTETKNTQDTVYTHPAAHAPSIITQDASNRFVTDTEKTAWTAKQDALGYTPLNQNLKGAANGLAELDGTGKVPASQLPSYVDDVLEYASKSAFPATGESGKIYVDTATNITWRWGGTAYVEISSSIALGETSATAYRGDRGKAAYDHSLVTGNPHGMTKADIGLSSADNTADSAKSVASAAILATSRTIAIGSGATGTATSFNGSANITIPITALNATYITAGTIPSVDRLPTITIAKGGTGATTAAAALTNLGAAPTAGPMFTDSISLGRKEGTTIGIGSTATGVSVTASNTAAHAEGSTTTASGQSSHAEGASTKASGNNSHAEGGTTIASGDYSHAEGYGSATTGALGSCSHAEGYQATASGNYSHAEGQSTKAIGANSHTEGSTTTASGSSSHAEGYQTTAYGIGSHSEGYNAIAGTSSTTESTWMCAHAEGSETKASATYSHAEGYATVASNNAAHAGGKFNKAMTAGGAANNTTGDAFVVGNGTSSTTLSNALRLTFGGALYALSAFNASGADYAEYFEWEDQNPDNEDRVGRFVTLIDKKIAFANEGDYILGVISALPCMIGNSDEDWTGRWLKDDFGRFLTEDVETSVTENVTKEIPILDEDGNETGEVDIIMEEIETGEIIKGWRYIQNPDYDPDMQYTERKDRPEWSAVGMVGVLAVRDDGTCETDGWCKCVDGGTATRAETRGFDTYRVCRRITDSIVEIIIKP